MRCDACDGSKGGLESESVVFFFCFDFPFSYEKLVGRLATVRFGSGSATFDQNLNTNHRSAFQPLSEPAPEPVGPGSGGSVRV